MEWSAAERRWRQSPQDQAALTAAIAARRRAGLPVSAEWIDARLFPERAVTPRRPLRVGRPRVALEFGVILPDGRRAKLPRSAEGPLQLPEHRSWWAEAPAPVTPGKPLRRAIRELSHMGCMGLELELAGDTGVAALLAEAPLIERLTMSARRYEFVEDFDALSRLRSLLELRLSGPYQLGPRSLSRIAKLDRLVRLGFAECVRVRDEGLESLNALESLTELDLTRTRVRGPGIARLRLPNLRRLSLRACPLTELDLSGLPALAFLDLTWCELRPAVPEGVRVRQTDPRVHLDELGGVTPVQGFGDVDGDEFYFRARGEHWSFEVDEAGPRHRLIEERWGNGPFDAGYMPLREADRILERCLMRYLEEQESAGLHQGPPESP